VLLATASAAAAWFVASTRARLSAERHLRDAEGRARAAEAGLEESRRQTETFRQELSSVQNALREAQVHRGATEARAMEMERSFQEQKLLLEDARVKLSEAFKSLAAEALKSNNQDFLVLAKQSLEGLQNVAHKDLEGKQKAIEELVKPIKDSLLKVDEKIHALEKARNEAYGALMEQVKSLAGTQERLQLETGNLVKALRAPTVRGRWGEIQLKRVVEMAGMLDHCDFYEQESVSTDEGRLRPDLIVRLPGGKNIIVDAKAPLYAYIEALEAGNDEERRLQKLKDHARQVRTHLLALSSKSYWDQFQSSPEFVVLFLPGETFFSAALEQDPALIEEGVNRRVILATPTTLISLLRAVAYGWRQELVAENAQRISQLGQELHERLATVVEHFSKLGTSLGRSIEAYNMAVASFEGRVLPSARKFKALGAGSKKELEALEPIDHAPRSVSPPETQSPSD
ncbi:MAG: DNA recombination protein RmuC, partial [Nitrospirae bacterium]|nr:DNA recombination protein RmuC [Nitrospirota bacterium]